MVSSVGHRLISEKVIEVGGQVRGMYKLYGSIGTGSVGPQAILSQEGVDYEMVLLDIGNNEHRSMQNLAMNPRGQVT